MTFGLKTGPKLSFSFVEHVTDLGWYHDFSFPYNCIFRNCPFKDCATKTFTSLIIIFVFWLHHRGTIVVFSCYMTPRLGFLEELNSSCVLTRIFRFGWPELCTSLHSRSDSLATFPHERCSVVIHTPSLEPSSLAVFKSARPLCSFLNSSTLRAVYQKFSPLYMDEYIIPLQL